MCNFIKCGFKTKMNEALVKENKKKTTKIGDSVELITTRSSMFIPLIPAMVGWSC